MSAKRSHHGPNEWGGSVGKLRPLGEPPLLDPVTGKFVKGHKRHGGRKFDPVTGRWSPNKITAESKKLLFEFAKYGLQTAKADYRKARKKSPARALGTLVAALEYILPKLARTEQVGPGGGPVVVELVSLSGPPPAPPRPNDTVEQPPEGGEE